MVATTPINGLRMAELTDTANAQTAFSNLGTDLDTRLFPRFATTAARDAAISSPVTGMVCFVAAFNLPMMYYASYWGFFPGTPLALIYRDTPQTIATAGAGSAVLFNQEDFDSLGAHSTTTNTSRYTPRYISL